MENEETFDTSCAVEEAEGDEPISIWVIVNRLTDRVIACENALKQHGIEVKEVSR